MTLEEFKIKVYSLIEEYSEDADDLTEDQDLALKMNSVINQIQNEMCRFKKIPATATLTVTEGQELNYKDIANDIYQLHNIRGVDYDTMTDNIIFNEDGTAKVYYFKYPKQIDSETGDDYKFELSTDVLEIMVYGVAADLLKSDVSSQYGAVYAARYKEMKQELDPRYAMPVISFSEGM